MAIKSSTLATKKFTYSTNVSRPAYRRSPQLVRKMSQNQKVPTKKSRWGL
ncbi:MAG: hypothetical protein AAGB01_08210 [Cyanobacteria bacterium P01_F01_bin.42]